LINELKMNRENINAYLQQGVKFLQQGNLKAAEEAFEHSLKINPRNPDALNMLSVVFNHQGKKRMR